MASEEAAGVPEETDWAQAHDLAEALARRPFHALPPEAGLRAVCNAVHAVVAAPAYYLYLLSAEGRPGERRLVLEYADLPFARSEEWAARLPDPRETDTLRQPPPALSVRPEHQDLGEMEEWCGPVLNVPLFALEDEGEEAFAGVLLCGPQEPGTIPDAPPEEGLAFSQGVAAAVRHVKAYEVLRSDVRAAQQQCDLRGRLLGSVLETERLVGLVLDLALATTHSSGGFVMLRPAEKNDDAPVHRAERYVPEGLLDALGVTQPGFFQRSAGEENEGVVLLGKDDGPLARFGLAALAAAPIRVGRERPPGVLAVFREGGAEADQAARPFGENEREALTHLAEPIRMAQRSEPLQRRFTERFFKTLRHLSDAYDARYEHTRGHSAAVARLAAALAEQMDAPPEQVEAVRRAGLVHDVGRCVTAAEGTAQAGLRHPEVGAALLGAMPFPPALVEAVRTHHEWHNGWGTPQGLAGEAIPPSGRILALAEFVAEVRAGDPVSEPQPPEAVARQVRERRGQQFAPAVADAFLELPEEKRL